MANNKRYDRNKKTTSMSITVLGTALVSALLVMPFANVDAAQHGGGAAGPHWGIQNLNNYLWNVDQTITILQKSPKTFWAMQWSFIGAGVGYAGLQTNTLRPDGTRGDMAIFSVWKANGVRGQGCLEFHSEGTGQSCRINFDVTNGVSYRLRIWRLESDRDGQWWGAWVKNNASGASYYIGSIRLNSKAMGVPSNFVEYWGEAVSCNKVPTSTTDWTAPTGNAGRYKSAYSGLYRGKCINAETTLTHTGARTVVR